MPIDQFETTCDSDYETCHMFSRSEQVAVSPENVWGKEDLTIDPPASPEITNHATCTESHLDLLNIDLFREFAIANIISIEAFAKYFRVDLE
jgi:hypothetical protein